MGVWPMSKGCWGKARAPQEETLWPGSPVSIPRRPAPGWGHQTGPPGSREPGAGGKESKGRSFEAVAEAPGSAEKRRQALPPSSEGGKNEKVGGGVRWCLEGREQSCLLTRVRPECSRPQACHPPVPGAQWANRMLSL